MPKKSTSPSEYDQRITIQTDVATSSDKDSLGAQNEDWIDSFTEWAAFEAAPSKPGGAEFATNEQRVVYETAVFRVRYHTSTSLISPVTNRIVFDGKIWNIMRAQDQQGKRIEIHIEVRTTNSVAS